VSGEGFNISAFLEEFDANEIDREYPNARKFTTGSIFISHDGADFHLIGEQIVDPVVFDRFADGYFLHNRRSGGSENYRRLVRAALHWCDKFMVAVSRGAALNEWVNAEVEWAIRNNRLIIVCRLDDSPLESVHPALSLRGDGRPNVRLVDFRDNISEAQANLAKLLDELLARSPYPRFPDGRPGRYQ
jgi:TIR domain